MSSAYAYGYGFGFAFDAETKLKVGDRVKHFVSGDLGTIGSFVSGNAVVTWDRGGSTSILSPAILIKASGGDAEITVSPRGGANSERHPARHEVDRAAIAAETGTTGGPPTHKATGEGRVRNGRMVMSSGTTWPSNDAVFEVLYEDETGQKWRKKFHDDREMKNFFEDHPKFEVISRNKSAE